MSQAEGNNADSKDIISGIEIPDLDSIFRGSKAEAESRPFVVILAGGIGAGKSTIAKFLKNKGLPLYDSDSEAKKLMNSSREILEKIKSFFGEECISPSGEIDRKVLADKVFGCDEALSKLNTIVHGEVRHHIRSWIDAQKGEKIVVVECAIPFTAGLDGIADEIWTVDAPEETRVERIMKRDNCSRQQAIDRIKSQSAELEQCLLKGRRINNA